MSTEITSIDIHESLSNVAEKFMESRFRRFPVIEGDKLVGQISRRDILRAMDQLSKEKQSS
jgi:CBS domain-containing protein